MSKQTVYAANHKQWSDSLVLTEDGRFWRTAGFRGWSETSKSAGRWESAGNELTLTWFEWGPEHLASRDGGRTFECTKGYQFTLRLPPADGVPDWLFRGHSQEQTVAEVRRLLRAELEALREARGEPEPPRAAELLAGLSRGLRPFAAALHASGHPAPAQLKHAFEAVGWDVRKNKSLEGSGPPGRAELEAFLSTALEPGAGRKRRRGGGAAPEPRPELVSYPAFAQQQQADAAATAFGETDTSVFAPVWCNRREPSMGDVPWGEQRVGAPPDPRLAPSSLSPTL